MFCTVGSYELGYEFEDKGPRGGRCIESDGIERKIHEAPSPSCATINVNISAVYDGRGREGFKGAMLRSVTSRK